MPLPRDLAAVIAFALPAAALAQQPVWQRIPNPESALVLQQDDLLWLVGDADRMRGFMYNGKGARE